MGGKCKDKGIKKNKNEKAAVRGHNVTKKTTVAHRLGHVNATTTTKIYAHAIQSADAAAAQVLDDLLSPAAVKHG